MNRVFYMSRATLAKIYPDADLLGPDLYLGPLPVLYDDRMEENQIRLELHSDCLPWAQTRSGQ